MTNTKYESVISLHLYLFGSVQPAGYYSGLCGLIRYELRYNLDPKEIYEEDFLGGAFSVM
jgi:hypothetical protein